MTRKGSTKMSAVTTRTPEQKKEIIQKIKAALKADKELTVTKACEDQGIKAQTYYNWTAALGAKKVRRQKKTKVEHTHALVPLTPETETPKFDFNSNSGNGKRPSSSQIANMLAEMNARSNLATIQAMFGE